MEQKKTNKLVIFFLALFVISFFGIKISQSFWGDANIVLDGNRLNVLIAKNDEQHYKGLGGREDLGEYDGMLFVYSAPFVIGVVMRDMLFPIDVVWLNDGVVVDIAPYLVPEPGVAEADLKVYFPRDKADMFLELEGGWTAKNNLKIGDKLEMLE